MGFVAALTAARRATAGGEHAAAANAWERVVAENPVNGPFWHHLADACYATGAYERALAGYERALALGYVFPWHTAYRIACCHARLGAAPAAREWLERALGLGLRDRTAAARDPAFEALRGDPLFLALAGEAPAPPDRAAGWGQDLDLLAREVKRLGYAPFRATAEDGFSAAVNELAAAADGRTDAEMIAGVMRILAMAGDAHTRLEPRGQAHPVLAPTLPLQAELFAEGLFVTAAEPRHAELVGARIEAVEGRPWAEVLAALAAFVPRDHEHHVLATAAARLRQVRLLHGIGLVRDPAGVWLDVVGRGGGSQSVAVTADAAPEDGQTAQPCPDGWLWLPEAAAEAGEPLPAHLRAWSRNYWFEHLPESAAVYFQFNRVAEGPDESLAAFAERLAVFVASRGVRRLIVDVRHNGGGNTFLEVPLLRRLMGLSGVRLFVIIGRRTFSAAQNFVTTLNRFTDAVFIGEPTGSGPNFVGETVILTLPWSGLRVSISDLYWQTSWPMDHRRWLAPDIHLPPTFADFAANRDPALEAALSCDLDLPAWLAPPES